MLLLVLLGFGLASASTKHHTEGFSGNMQTAMAHLINVPMQAWAFACGSETMPDAFLSSCDADDATGNRDFAGFYEMDQNTDTILRIEQCGNRMIMSRKTPPAYRWRIVDFTIGGGVQGGGFDVNEMCQPEKTVWNWTADDKLDVTPVLQIPDGRCNDLNGNVFYQGMGSQIGFDIKWEKQVDGGLKRTATFPLCLVRGSNFNGIFAPVPPQTFTKLDCDVNGSLEDCDTRRRLLKAQL